MARINGIADYPLAENRPDLVKTARGKTLDDLTLKAVDGRRGDAGRSAHHARRRCRIRPGYPNWRVARPWRAISNAPPRSSMCRRISCCKSMKLLRPGRAKSKDDLLAAAKTLRETYGAEKMADFVEEAAEVYERRGLFTYSVLSRKLDSGSR